MAVNIEGVLGRLLKTQMEYVREDLEKYTCAMVVTFTEDGQSTVDFPKFDGRDQKEAIYRRVVEDAKRRNASAIITVNHAFARTVQPHEPAPSDGEWNSRNADPCIVLTASGPGMQSVSLTLGYRIRGKEVEFDPQPERLTNVKLSLLPGWPEVVN